jgi:hypothetical protein
MASYERSLPIGVAILAVLIGIVGFFLLIVGVLLLLVGIVGYTVPGYVALFGASILGGAILTIFAIILLAVAFGLWNTELWALVLSIIVVILLLIGDAITQGLSLGVILLGLLLLYLVLVNRHFR